MMRCLQTFFPSQHANQLNLKKKHVLLNSDNDGNAIVDFQLLTNTHKFIAS